MASKVSMILSVIFVFQLLLMIGDMVSLQMIQTQMQAMAVYVTHRVALTGQLDEAMIEYVEDQGMQLTCLQTCQPQFKDTMVIELSRSYTPLIISDEVIEIKMVRYILVGAYY